jgi:hypothetical protein
VKQVVAAAVILAALFGASPSSEGNPLRTVSARPSISPSLFQTISSGVALIKTYTCGGRPIAEGSGFLVGDSVVMTARHVVRGACRVRVHVGGATQTSVHWSYWSTGLTNQDAADLATIKLPHATVGGYVFRIRSSLPPIGSNLSSAGYPLGHPLSLNQGKLVSRLKAHGAPLLAVKMLGAEGGSGSPFIDDRGRVVGILQIGLGSTDILGERTTGVLLGLDLVRWWGPHARLDLCHAYPHGGIAGCPSSTPPPPPPPPPAPKPHIDQCWAQPTPGGSSYWTPDLAQTTFLGNDILTQGASTFVEVAQLDSTPDAPIAPNLVTLTLTQPNGQVFGTVTDNNWQTGDDQNAYTLDWTYADGRLFFQHPEVAGSGAWTFTWTGPDGQTCSNEIMVN